MRYESGMSVEVTYRESKPCDSVSLNLVEKRLSYLPGRSKHGWHEEKKRRPPTLWLARIGGPEKPPLTDPRTAFEVCRKKPPGGLGPKTPSNLPIKIERFLRSVNRGKSPFWVKFGWTRKPSYSSRQSPLRNRYLHLEGCCTCSVPFTGATW